MSQLFCFGLGYSALVLADNLRAKGWQISGTVRQTHKRVQLQPSGIDCHIIGQDDVRLIDALKNATHILSSVPPDQAGDPILQKFENAIVQSSANWIGYLSSTAVYGDYDGNWVDEDAACQPRTTRGKARLVAEQQWQALTKPIHIFRLAGIYGPGRSVLDRIRAGQGQRIDKPGHYFSRIHVADIAAALQLAIKQPRPDIYNLADDFPCGGLEVTDYGYDLLGVPKPPAIPYAEAQLSPGMYDFYRENKRVSNGRLKTQFGMVLTYPSYREGLKACLA